MCCSGLAQSDLRGTLGLVRNSSSCVWRHRLYAAGPWLYFAAAHAASMDCRSGTLRLDTSLCGDAVACEGTSAFSEDEKVLDGVGDGDWVPIAVTVCGKLFEALSLGIIANGVLSPVP